METLFYANPALLSVTLLFQAGGSQQRRRWSHVNVLLRGPGAALSSFRGAQNVSNND